MSARAKRWIVIGAFAAAGAATGACARGDRTEESRVSAPGPSVPAADHVAGPTIYDLDLALVDETGKNLHLADLRGETLVAAMMYSSCKSVCPRVTEDMKGIERQLSDRDKRGVKFVLFSLDPGRDTPEALRHFGEEHRLDPARWRLFAMAEDGVRDLAAVLGVKYVREDNGDIAHSAMIFVIDREGVIRHRQVGLTDKPTEIVAALNKARS
jgi:protein SCO1